MRCKNYKGYTPEGEIIDANLLPTGKWYVATSTATKAGWWYATTAVQLVDEMVATYKGVALFLTSDLVEV